MLKILSFLNELDVTFGTMLYVIVSNVTFGTMLYVIVSKFLSDYKITTYTFEFSRFKNIANYLLIKC